MKFSKVASLILLGLVAFQLNAHITSQPPSPPPQSNEEISDFLKPKPRRIGKAVLDVEGSLDVRGSDGPVIVQWEYPAFGRNDGPGKVVLIGSDGTVLEDCSASVKYGLVFTSQFIEAEFKLENGEIETFSIYLKKNDRELEQESLLGDDSSTDGWKGMGRDSNGNEYST